MKKRIIRASSLLSMMRHGALLTGICAGLLVAPVSGGAGEFSTWANQMKIVFTGYTPAETLENFPALVTFSNRPGFAYSQFLSETHADLRFTDSSLNQELAYEVEQWDTNGVSLVWVQVPRLEGTNTTIWAHWGKANQGLPAYTTNGATWDPSFRGVWHLAEPVADEGGSGLHFDSTSNHFNGVQSGNSLTNGFIGMAQYFDGNDKIAMGAVVTPGAYTKEAWVKVAGGGNLISGHATHAIFISGPNLAAGHNGDWNGVVDATPFPMGVWQHVAVTYDSTVNSGQLTLYRNGVQVGCSTGKPAPGADEITYFASHAGANYLAGGQIDEGRISSIARSSNWLWACWMNQASNAEFETTTVIIPSVKNGKPSEITSTSAVLNGLLVSNRVALTTFVTVYWGTNDAGAATENWQNRSRFNGEQAAGPLSNKVEGLLPNQTYYFTYATSNSSGMTISQPSRQFDTWGPPAVDNEAALVMNETNVNLRGRLIDGHSAQATFFWGTNPLQLTNATPAGQVMEGLFSVPLVNLNKDDTYYYRCFVSNAWGVAWAASSTNFSTTLSQVLALEQKAEFSKAFILGTALQSKCRDAATLETLRATMARLKQEKKAALDMAFAIESLETHRDVAERELEKEPEVSVLLLRRVVREREGALLINASSMLTAMTDPELPALLIGRLKTCKDKKVFGSLLADLEQVKDLIVPGSVPDLVDAMNLSEAGDSPRVRSILATVARKEIEPDILAQIYRQAQSGVTFTNRYAVALLGVVQDRQFNGDEQVFGEVVGDPDASVKLMEYMRMLNAKAVSVKP